MEDLTRLEEIVLVAVLKLKDNAYGVTIRSQLSETLGRIFPYGTLYSTLDTLFKKGYVLRQNSEPMPVRGGRSKTFYRITKNGIAALNAAFELHRVLWDESLVLALGKG